MKVSVLFARFPFGAVEHPDVSDWVAQTIIKAKKDDRIHNIGMMRVDDTPITMSRNRVLKTARAQQFDYVLMIDSDMSPDLPLPGAKPFWDSSIDFLLSDQGRAVPSIIAAPYCGPPPPENIYVFQWTRRQSDHPNVDMALAQFTREEARLWTGIQEVAALPTGLCLIDMRVLDKLPKPQRNKASWFDYEWNDDERSEKGSTEDVYFTRNVSLAGGKCLCNWDAWAGHWKRKCVGKPQVFHVDDVRKEFIAAGQRGNQNDRLMIVGGDDVAPGVQVGRPEVRLTDQDKAEQQQALTRWRETLPKKGRLDWSRVAFPGDMSPGEAQLAFEKLRAEHAEK